MPIETGEVATRDPDEAFQAIANAYATVAPSPRFRAPSEFDVRMEHIGAGPVGGERWRIASEPMRLQWTMDPLPFFCVFRVCSGRVDELRAEGQSIVPGPGDVVQTSSPNAFDIGVTQLRHDLVHIPWETLDRVATELTGHTGRVRFPELRPVSSAAAERWRQLSDYVHAEFREPFSALSEPLVQVQMAELIAATALTTFANSATGGESPQSRTRLTPDALRRAVLFIDACAHLPITVTDIAEAVGVSTRTLRAGFSRHLEMTPAAYLRRARMDRVHGELTVSDAGGGSTVETIAREWGFANPGRFAAEYRSAYGCSPEQTLNR